MLVAVAGVQQALIGVKAGLDDLPVGRQRGRFAAPQFTEIDPASGLYDAGRSQVIQVDQYPWGQAVKIAGPVGFVGQDTGNAQRF